MLAVKMNSGLGASRVPLPTNLFMTSAHKAGIPFDESKVTRRTGVLRGDPEHLRVGSWRRPESGPHGFSERSACPLTPLSGSVTYA
jgi:hypothetical protein